MEINELKQKFDLPSVCQANGVELRRSGSGFIGLCPFHDDHHPSFSVYLASSGWYFKCHSGSCGLCGDVIDFIGYQKFGQEWNKHDSAQFKEVLKDMGEDRVKVTPQVQVPANRPTADKNQKASSSIRFLWDIALGVYADNLARSEAAADYIAQRHIPAEVVRTYRFGFCPPEGSSLRYVARIFNKKDPDLLQSGLFRESSAEDKHLYEFLYGRITFADVDAHRNPLYLYGRWLPGSGTKEANAKYLGLPGFSKPVFGLGLLSENQDKVFLMEGPINAMLCRSWGWDAIAFSGALPSPEQVLLINQQIIARGKRLIPVIDNDRAGAAASERWRELIPQIEAPILLPAEVKGRPIKDINDLHCASPDAHRLFKRLVR